MGRRRSWTIVFVPDDETGPRQVTLGPGSVRLLTILVVLLIVILGFGVATYWRVARVAIETTAVKEQNRQLQAQVETVWELERLMADLLETDYKLRTQLGIEFPEDWPGYNYQLGPEIAPDTGGERPAGTLPEGTIAESGAEEERALLFVMPVTQGWPSAEFGSGEGASAAAHTGIDFAARTGTPIRAAADGQVVFAGMDDRYGYLLEIRHSTRLSTRYGHCQRLLVRQDQLVKRGDIIAYVGSTGRVTTGPHLHFEVLRNGRPVNPRDYLPSF